MKGLPLALAVTTLVGCSTRDARRHPVPEPAALQILGSELGVSMAKVHLGASQTFRFEASSCQQVLVFVEKGTVRASMTWLETGRAARFHTPTMLQGMSEQGAEVFAVTVLADEALIDAVDWQVAPDNPACLARTEEVIVSDPKRSGPFVHAGGRLSVMIYLEQTRDGPPVASLGTLHGDPTLGVPEHIHERSAEVLWIQEGSGTMRVGEHNRSIRPGTFVYVPPQTIHGFVPDGSRSLFAYQVYLPAGPEQRFR